MKLVSGFIGLVILLLAVVFALANKHAAAITLWPFDFSVSAPLSLFVLGAFVLGLCMGMAIAWFSMIPQRLKVRRMRKDFSTLQGKIEDLQQAAASPVMQDDMLFLPRPSFGRRFWRKRA